jgi:succinate-semialdehyde dehydrogenase/glutarate-semialdehyde dehydrogenase
MSSPDEFEAINPATGEVVGRYAGCDAKDRETILAETHACFSVWRKAGFAQRASHMRDAAKVLRKRKEEFAKLMALEMGKPLVDGRAEIEKCAGSCEYFAEHAERFLAREPVEVENAKAFVAFNPLGVVLAVMPWNFPFWQAIRCAAPTLMAGNTMVLKHASNVPGCALAIEKVFREAGFPPGAFRSMLVGSRDVAALIRDPRIAAVSLTGSVEAGRQVAREAGGALKKCVLELGGSDPYLVLEDADPVKAAEVAVRARLVNGGQSCIAGKRFIVVARHLERFEQAMVERMQAIKPGDPLAEGVVLGPLARRDLRDELHEQVEKSIAGGARCLTGGKVPPGPGAFYPPTVLSHVPRGTPAHDDELFGPVAAIISARDDGQAIHIANDSQFGLGAGVLSGDLARAERIAAEEIEAGCVFVNDNVRSDSRLPFGGIKASGYGRELSAYGIREFVNIKTVYVRS